MKRVEIRLISDEGEVKRSDVYETAWELVADEVYDKLILSVLTYKENERTEAKQFSDRMKVTLDHEGRIELKPDNEVDLGNGRKGYVSFD